MKHRVAIQSIPAIVWGEDSNSAWIKELAVMTKGFQSCLQIFPSAEMVSCADFYQTIGFRAVEYLDSQEPHICLYRDAIELVLTRSRLARISPNREIHGYGYDAYFIASNQQEILVELQAKGVKIVKDLQITDYANNEFVFEDPEGRWIAVGSKDGRKNT